MSRKRRKLIEPWRRPPFYGFSCMDRVRVCHSYFLSDTVMLGLVFATCPTTDGMMCLFPFTSGRFWDQSNWQQRTTDIRLDHLLRVCRRQGDQVVRHISLWQRHVQGLWYLWWGQVQGNCRYVFFVATQNNCSTSFYWSCLREGLKKTIESVIMIIPCRTHPPTPSFLRTVIALGFFFAMFFY